jgi:small-conductance mechanosensitive channel
VPAVQTDLLLDFDWPSHPWITTGLRCAAALSLALAATRLAYLALGRALADRLLLGHLLRQTRPQFLPLLPLLGIGAVLELAPDTLRGIDLLRRLDTVALIAVLSFATARAIDATAEWILRRHRLDVADNLEARRAHTRTRVLSRSLIFLTLLLGLSGSLMTFPAVRQFGMSLLASAGVAGLVIGLAAKSVLGNLLAGVQIALAQPIRIDDVLVVQGEWGRVEEITATYVVLAIWDQRRLIIPLQWFIENPFANWTHTTAQIIGTVLIWVDYATPLEPLRIELGRILKAAPEWDGRVNVLQVTDANASAIQLRALCSAPDSGHSWDLCCKVREGLVGYLQREHPNSLPHLRIADAPAPAPAPAAPSAQRVSSPTP